VGAHVIVGLRAKEENNMETRPPSRPVRRFLELYRRAGQLIPGGTQLLSRRPSRFASGVSPIYAVRARGARF